jgi:wyosine [tRNA(Phe)-imidazoG37] synthetase (radical SAM superfamily)
MNDVKNRKVTKRRQFIGGSIGDVVQLTAAAFCCYCERTSASLLHISQDKTLHSDEALLNEKNALKKLGH